MRRVFSFILSAATVPGVASSVIGYAQNQQGTGSAQLKAEAQSQQGNRQGTQQNNPNQPSQPGGKTVQEQNQNRQSKRDRNRSQGRRNRQRDDEQRASRLSDAEIAAMLAVQQRFAIGMSQAGRGGASSNQVRDFADRLVQEHNQLLVQLQASVQFETDSQSPNDNNPNNPNNPNDSHPNLPPPQIRRAPANSEGSGQPSDNSTNQPGTREERPGDRKPNSSIDQSNLHIIPPQTIAALLLPAAFEMESAQEARAEKKAPAAPKQRTNPPLVTPGQSPQRTTQNPEAARNNDAPQQRDDALDQSMDSSLNSAIFSNSPIVRAMQQIAARRLAMARQNLGHVRGNDFDRRFMQIQVSLHVELSATLSVFETMVSSQQLRQWIHQAQGLDERHLAEAHRILQGLDGSTAIENTDTTQPDDNPTNSSGDETRPPAGNPPPQARPRKP